ncbi:MAG: hypothetical protein AB8B56_08425 [Crocinitomicaceae bacterium]
MHPILDALRSALGFFQEYGWWVAIPVFLLVLIFGFAKKHMDENPSTEAPEWKPVLPEKELTPEEDKNEGLKSLGCLLLFLIVALIIVIYLI